MGNAVVVITGGAGGLGTAMARRFTSAGASVASLDKGTPAGRRDGVRDYEVDVTDQAAVADSCAAITRDLGPPTVLINNAGIQRIGPVGRQSLEDWTAVIQTNLTAPFICTSLILPALKAAGGGAIVNVSSAAALLGLGGRAAYSAAKAGLLALTRVTAIEAAPFGVRVNAVIPSTTKTALVAKTISDGDLDEHSLLEEIPLGRLAEPEEIASVVHFLAGHDASYVTGQTVVADGGWSLFRRSVGAGNPESPEP
jgi:NAD(P)-dependent dehydrogenase (short-subunit alcohol dehydrogenase family)